MKSVGFKKAKVGIFDETFKIAESMTIEGTTNKGAARTFSIEGMTAEMVKTFGSNKAYKISKKGIGDLKTSFAGVDVPLEFDKMVLGLKAHTSGFLLGGAETEAPYSAVIYYDESPQGEPIAFALFRGAWAKGSVEGSTTEGENRELEEESYEMSCVVNEEDEGWGIAVGEEQVTALEAYTFPTAVPAG